MDIVVWIALVAAVAAAGWGWFRVRQLSKSRGEYKELFETSDSEYKNSQERLQELLAVDVLKTTMMERATDSLESAGKHIAVQTERFKVLQESLQAADKLAVAQQEKLCFQEAQYGKLLGQKKSSEVRTGKIAEQMAPFLGDYPFDPKSAKFIGDPIDFCHFLDDKIVFVEVKSGKSQLSKKQRHIRDLIAAGKVDFTIYRVKGE